MMGRLCGSYHPETREFTTIVVCSCGHSFYGASASQADQRFNVHARGAAADE